MGYTPECPGILQWNNFQEYIRRPERRHNCDPDLWWWVADGGPFSEKQSIIILHKNLFTWQPWLRKYAGKFGWRRPDLIDWIFVAKWTKDHLKLPPKKSSSVFNLCRRIFQPKLISSERKALRRKSTMVILVFVIEVHVFVFDLCKVHCICHEMVQVVLALVLYFYCSCNCAWSYPLIPDL